MLRFRPQTAAMQLTRFTSYEQYIETQCRVTASKPKSVWMTATDVEAVAAAVRRHVPGAQAGMCHGVRNGWEAHALRAALAIDVYGTEIADVAKALPYLIQWDFHEDRPDWVGRFDFVYSNSLDHSYDPKKAVDCWMRSLQPQGVCILHWSGSHTWGYTPADCFSATREEYIELIGRTHRFIETVAVPRTDARTQERFTTYLLIGAP